MIPCFAAEEVARFGREGDVHADDFAADAQLIDDFTEAVLTAASSAEAGDIVLLSPACAAFDRFKNFAQRGEYFKKLIMELE